ncbi:MAG: protein kinase domain-containing protein [Isosphaeraceae bacterium]
MSSVQSSPRRDDTSSRTIALLVRRYEADWRSATRFRPDPRDYLPDDIEQRLPVLTALLRADLVLGWRAHEPCPVEWYRARYPELDDESLLALIYEEYCLKEEAGESPTAAEYQARFPDVARSFQEVIEIHALVRRAGDPSSRAPRENGPSFPAPGQTIAGFRLVAELGRGAFARVYLAEEQHLADRPVALKVSRTGSREPETLARLQHTHIVPVYSSRTDPLTGLHLLCMPYLGRVTLLQILHHPAIRSARSGADLLSLLDSLEPQAAVAEKPSSRAALARLTYARAIAWWGARMAEALEHAHDRGVLHRDIKPSNVLVTGDGLPMLVDFNLSREITIDGPEADVTVGGTLGYMAPERLVALAEGLPDHVDARCDIYALGVVLFDCLVRVTGAFALPSTCSTLTESLQKTAEARRVWPMRLCAAHPDVPAALEAVVNRCLAPEPADRYRSAADLAADLQAVADQAPLRTATEPIPSRLARWLRRNSRRLAVAAPIILALGIIAYASMRAQLAAIRVQAEVSHEIDEGRRAAGDGRLDVALSHFETALRLAEGHPRLRGFQESARAEAKLARQTKEIRDRADALFASGDRLRFLLLYGRDPGDACTSVESALANFSIPSDPNWIKQPPLALLDDLRRTQLESEVNELLFLWVWALFRDQPRNPSAARLALTLCDMAMGFATPIGPWQVIRERSSATLRGDVPPARKLARPSLETSARGCFQWALLCELEGDPAGALAWLERATSLRVNDYWPEMYLGYYHKSTGQIARALEDYKAAIALRPELPWAWYDRALVHQARGEWQLALDDLNRARASPFGADFWDLRLELGVVKQFLGDEAGARAAYEAVIASGADGYVMRAARLNRAMLDADTGLPDRAWAEYNSLLDLNPRDVLARQNRALLALRFGRSQQAEADLTILLRDAPERADMILARRAVARLALGRLEAAEADAAGAYRRKPTPSRQRLWIRTLLALHRAEDLCWLNQPDDLTLLPGGGPSLQADLRATAERLLAPAGAGKPGRATSRIHGAKAVLLSALNDRAALREATRAIELAPESAEAHLVRARVCRRSGDRRAALAEVDLGLALVPFDGRFLELRGALKTEMGNPEAGLIDLDRAIVRGAEAGARRSRALALMALRRDEDAVREWTNALDDDPEDPQAYLGRARAMRRLGLCDRALVDLGQAVDWASDNPLILTRITIAYAGCLASRPDRLPRWLALVRRTWSTWFALAHTAADDNR